MDGFMSSCLYLWPIFLISVYWMACYIGQYYLMLYIHNTHGIKYFGVSGADLRMKKGGSARKNVQV